MGRKSVMTKDDVLGNALSEIRSKFGDGAIMRLGDEQIEPIDVVSTGILPLDVALQIGGMPRGRIIEIFGPEGGGKTTIALHVIAEAQKLGGKAAFIDAEHALDPKLAGDLGVDVPNLYLSQPSCGEEALYIVDVLVKSSVFDIVVVDSVAALTPKAEIDGEMGQTQQVGSQARLMSYALRRLTASISKTNTIVIFINQLRAKIQSGYGQGPSETTSGGRALKFYSSVRVEVKRGKQVMQSDVAIGHELFIKIVKNKLAPPFRTAHTTLIYGKGVPNSTAIVDLAIDNGIIKKKGSWLYYKGENLGQGKEGVAFSLEKQDSLLKEIRDDILKKVQSINMGLNDDESVPPEKESDFSLEEHVLNGELPLDIPAAEYPEN